METLYEKSSLILNPGVYDTGKVYCTKPFDGSGDLTFTRATTATRVNSNGLIEKAQVNLALRSNTFNTTWIPSNASVTGGQSGYDGTNDAWLLSKSTAYGSIYQTGISVGNSSVYTFSVYMKAGTQNYGSIRFWTNNSGADFRVKFDLTTGAISTASANNGTRIDAVATDVGSGWWRVSVTGLTGQTSATLNIYAGDTADASGTIYIQDAQLNYGLVAQTYVETTTAAVVSGITNDMPRLNYDPANPTCPSLLLEPSRTNLVTSSEFIDTSAGWGLTSVSVTDNATTSPEGVANAAKLTATANFSKTIASLSLSGSTTYTASFYVKDISAGSSLRFVAYDQTNAATLKDENYSADISTTQWTRLSYSFTTTTAATVQVQFVRDLNSGEEVYVYGFQCEAASYGSSYIPSYGSSATRTADACSKTGISSLIGQTAGTLFVEFDFQKDIDSAYRISLSDGTTSNRIQLGTYGNEVQVYVQTAGVTQVFALSGTITTGTHKMALAYASNDYVAYLDGSAIITDTSASVPACSKLGFEIPDGTGLFEHPVKQTLLFKTRLSNADLATLTSL